MKEVEVPIEFATDVVKGLTAKSKFLNSKYLYDTEGSRIFQDIMNMPEYYLTDCELEIFQNNKGEILDCFLAFTDRFDLIDLGAGDGTKTKILLNYFVRKGVDFQYIPIDISASAIDGLEKQLIADVPKLRIQPLIGDYFKMIGGLNREHDTRKVIMFLGSNIGNFSEEESVHFFRSLKAVMQKDDLLFIGFDLKKDPKIVLDAYNDPHGYTSAFNYNLLHRINRELKADIDVNGFEHFETYDESTGTASSYLKSIKPQEVQLLGHTIKFLENELIFMEISQKYDSNMINSLADIAGFKVFREYYDARKYFVNSVWTMK